MKMLDKVISKVYQNSLETCEYIGGYENSSSTIKVKCLIHGNEFETKWENVRRDDRAHHICPLCQEEDKNKRYREDQEELECAYCKKRFMRAKSKVSNSKSGLFFCCREHKDLSQRIDSGKEFDIIRPEHYGSGSKNYRDLAFRAFEHKCACCGWNEDIRILEVHHIDSNHENNQISNLMILCPTCHRKITLGYYDYDAERKILISK